MIVDKEKGGICWASYSTLVGADLFMVTKTLFDIENQKHWWINSSLHCCRRFEYPWVFYTFQPYSKNEKVLDAGGGKTVFDFLLASEVGAVYNVDLDPEAIDYLKLNMDGCQNLFPMLGDIRQMNFADGSFDKAMCISVLEHVDRQDIMPIIDELLRVTKIGGKVAITAEVATNSNDRFNINDIDIMAHHYGFGMPILPSDKAIFGVAPDYHPFALICMLLVRR